MSNEEPINYAKLLREAKEKGANWQTPQELLSSLVSEMEREGDTNGTGSWFSFRDIQEAITEHANEWKRPELAAATIQAVKTHLETTKDDFQGEPMQVLSFPETVALLNAVTETLTPDVG